MGRSGDAPALSVCRRFAAGAYDKRAPVSTAHAPLRALALPVAATAVVVLASNILVQYPFRAWGLADYLTWGAFSYPLAFLVTDVTNRHFGAADARRVVYGGFVAAVALSAWF